MKRHMLSEAPITVLREAKRGIRIGFSRLLNQQVTDSEITFVPTNPPKSPSLSPTSSPAIPLSSPIISRPGGFVRVPSAGASLRHGVPGGMLPFGSIARWRLPRNFAPFAHRDRRTGFGQKRSQQAGPECDADQTNLRRAVRSHRTMSWLEILGANVSKIPGCASWIKLVCRV